MCSKKRAITPRNQSQKAYIDAIRNYDIVFGIGPAGTGKTYLAVAMAVSALANETVRSIILTRPAVEAGEKLGFLPGDLTEKINPYLIVSSSEGFRRYIRYKESKKVLSVFAKFRRASEAWIQGRLTRLITTIRTGRHDSYPPLLLPKVPRTRYSRGLEGLPQYALAVL